MKLDFDCVVIGAGIAGMTSALYMKRSGINVAIIEKGAPGGQINRTNLIANYPGIKSIDGVSLSMTVYEQTQNLDIPFIYGNVNNIIDDKNVKIVITDKDEIITKKIVIATGRFPKELGLPNEKQLIGKGISWCATCDGNFFKEKDVAVVGGGNTAIEEANYLSSICHKVYVICRKDKFKAEIIAVDYLSSKPNVDIIYNRTVLKLNEADDKLESITLDNNKKINVEGLFVCVGSVTNLSFLKNLNIKQTNGYIEVDKQMRTNLDAIYAIGDVINKEVYQLTTAVGEAAIVANCIRKDLNK